MNIYKRPLSEIEFLKLLCDQSLLCRSHLDPGISGEWPDEPSRAAALDRDWYWIAALVPVFVDTMLDECERTQSRTIFHTSTFSEADGMADILHRMNAKAPLFQYWFINWAGYAATQALCFSPHFHGSFEITRQSRVFRFSHHNGNACFERLS